MRALRDNAVSAESDARARRRRRLRWVLVYLILLAASHATIWVRSGGEDEPFEPSDPRIRLTTVPVMLDAGPHPTRKMRLAYLEWEPEGVEGKGSQEKPPIVLLHGSPGGASDFDEVAPLLAAAGYRVIAPDLPGFGDSERNLPTYSTLSHARAVLVLLDRLGIRRAHIVGWSMGGGVALHAADLAPGRVASLTLMASVGDQATEGSGSWAFEHAKYLAGYVLLVIVPEAIPHFGLLGTRETGLGEFRHSFIRNFLDSDQRPYARIMRSLRTPTMILHGRHDFLTSDATAALSHRYIGPSRLVMLDASHFLPFLQPEETAAHLLAFVQRHDVPGVPALRQEVDLAPEPAWVLGPVGAWAEWGVRALPWWAEVAVIAAAAIIAPTVTVLLTAVLGATVLLDYGVALVGLMIGAAAACRRRGGQDWSVLRVAGAVAAVIPLYTAARVLSGTVVEPLAEDAGVPGLVLALVVALVALVLLRYGITRRGRRLLTVRLRRAAHHEFWPGWVFYLPLAPYLLYLAVRHGGIATAACINRGIPSGGGLIGESKTTIINALCSHPESSRQVLPARMIEAGGDPDERARRAIALIRAELGGFPVVLKPDAAQRGFGMRLARSEQDVRAYFAAQPRAVQVQAYHPGPHEIGVTWVRRPESVRGAGGSGNAGFIYAVTRKDFPVVTGDGRRTLGELVLAHPRYRLQAGTFRARFGERWAHVPAAGEAVRLVEAGNHCQGTLFRDGADLITPALEAAVDAVARRFGWKPGDGDDTQLLDYGRFDIRFRSEAALMAGDLDGGIVELNGTTGEPTALYDPDRSLLWAYRLLFGQWRRIFELGALRRAQGVRPMRVREAVAQAWRYYRGRPGSAVSD
jgi:pimeloyl-ACP methyl ester carboxylesterase